MKELEKHFKAFAEGIPVNHEPDSSKEQKYPAEKHVKIVIHPNSFN